ncbi:unnamed protein product [Ixodes hexagonus]
MTSLLPPRFAVGVPAALNYGGIGLELATELARNLSPDQAWLDCLSQLEPRANLAWDDALLARVVLATQVVSDLQQARAGTSASLPGFESLWEDQLFFVALCVGFCARGDSGSAHRCNLAAKNSARFSAAFQCSLGASMNPSARCAVKVQPRKKPATPRHDRQ